MKTLPQNGRRFRFSDRTVWPFWGNLWENIVQTPLNFSTYVYLTFLEPLHTRLSVGNTRTGPHTIKEPLLKFFVPCLARFPPLTSGQRLDTVTRGLLQALYDLPRYEFRGAVVGFAHNIR